MNSADHRGVAALNELETNEQTGHSCAPEVAGAINVGLEAQRKDTAGVSHLSAAPQPVPITAEEIDRIAALTEKAMEDGLRGFMRTWGWQQFARTLIENLAPYGLRVAPQPVQTADAGKRAMRMEATVTALSNGGESPFSAVQQAALASKPVQGGEQSGKWEGAEEWMPLAWELCANECGEDACTELIWEGGPIPEPWGDRWLKYEGQAREMIAMVRKHVPGLAAQPVREPMSEEQAEQIRLEVGFAGGASRFVEFARAIERHHGITKE